jgi:hypothetical protein
MAETIPTIFRPTNFDTTNPTTEPGQMKASVGVKTMSLAMAIPKPRQAARNATTTTPIRANVLSGIEVFMDALEFKDGGYVQKDDLAAEIDAFRVHASWFRGVRLNLAVVVTASRSRIYDEGGRCLIEVNAGEIAFTFQAGLRNGKKLIHEDEVRLAPEGR